MLFWTGVSAMAVVLVYVLVGMHMVPTRNLEERRGLMFWTDFWACIFAIGCYAVLAMAICQVAH